MKPFIYLACTALGSGSKNLISCCNPTARQNNYNFFYSESALERLLGTTDISARPQSAPFPENNAYNG